MLEAREPRVWPARMEVAACLVLSDPPDPRAVRERR